VIAAAEQRFLPFVAAYAIWNPHVALRFSLNGEVELDAGATAPTWPKWHGSNPIPIHWFDAQTFARLLAAQVNRDRQLGRRSRPLRQVIGEFHGLSGTAKRAEILAELGAERSTLKEFYLTGESVNAAGVRHCSGDAGTRVGQAAALASSGASISTRLSSTKAATPTPSGITRSKPRTLTACRSSSRPRSAARNSSMAIAGC
jgi:hypothetical protein